MIVLLFVAAILVLAVWFTICDVSDRIACSLGATTHYEMMKTRDGCPGCKATDKASGDT